MSQYTRNSHCNFCGSPFPPNAPWPRSCTHCSNITYINPIPVAVALVPVDDTGLLVIQRGIPPKLGQLALPGGFVDAGESWQEACTREVFEETQITLDPKHVTPFDVQSTQGGPILIFGLTQPISSAQLPPFTPTPETTARSIIKAPQELAFPLHTDAAHAWFAQRT